MLLENPHLIQEASDTRPSRIPLILIHDGGGATFEYHLIPFLDPPRAVHAIANPSFNPSPNFPESWPGADGGMAAMASLYEGYIRQVLEDERANGGDGRSVLLGGWSLGGLISLEIAHRAATRRLDRERRGPSDGPSPAAGRSGEQQPESDSGPDINVTGILLIDSVFPYEPSSFPSKTATGAPLSVAQHRMTFPPSTQPRVAESVTRCMNNALTMIRHWTPPTWSGDEKAEGSVEAPPVLLLRARDRTAVTEPEAADGALAKGAAGKVGEGKSEEKAAVVVVSRVDVDRDRPLLGWEIHRPGLVCGVAELEGGHYDIFKDVDETGGRVEWMARKIGRACELLEEGGAMEARQEGWLLRF